MLQVNIVAMTGLNPSDHSPTGFWYRLSFRVWGYCVPAGEKSGLARVVSCLLIACLLVTSTGAGALDEAAAWIESDLDDREPRFDARTEAVNEGELEFLETAPGQRVLQTRNTLILKRESLENGWVELSQCQGNLDPVAAVEIVYRYHAIRNLQVLSSRGIDTARVEKGAVQLTNVGVDAEVCVGAEVRVLKPAGEGRYEIQSGPFHRRFLDGYYPVHLDYRLSYPPDLLTLEAVHPPAQAGFTVTRLAGQLMIDALFEGRLTIQVSLRETGP